MKDLIIVVIAWNIIVFLMYGTDKLKAMSGRWRISERTLLTCTLLLGGVGAFLGMRFFHHKTRNTKFRVICGLSFIVTLLTVFHEYIGFFA